jgi:hypothetical protein
MIGTPGRRPPRKRFGQSGTPEQINLGSPESPTGAARATPSTSSDLVRPMLASLSPVPSFPSRSLRTPWPWRSRDARHSVPSSVALLTVAACLVSGRSRPVHRAGLVWATPWGSSGRELSSASPRLASPGARRRAPCQILHNNERHAWHARHTACCCSSGQKYTALLPSALLMASFRCREERST